MASWHPAKCKDCKVRAADGARISKRGLCADCAIRRQVASIEAMTNKTGSHYDTWQANAGEAGRPPTKARTA